MKKFSLPSNNDSTESAFLKAHNDIALSIDGGFPVVLVLLVLTAAFNATDHSVLLSHLQHYVGICASFGENATIYVRAVNFMFAGTL